MLGTRDKASVHENNNAAHEQREATAEGARDTTQFHAKGEVPPVASEQAPSRPSASEMAYGNSGAGDKQQLQGSWLDSPAAALGGLLLGGPIGAAAVGIYQATHPPEPTKAGEEPTMTSNTLAAAPSGAPASRTTVGVGEHVHFTGSAAGQWSASGGAVAADAKAPTEMIWKAPLVTKPTDFTITLDVEGKKVTKVIHVVPPVNIKYKKHHNMKIGVDVAGAGMRLDMQLFPLTVSFGAVSVREVPGGPNKVTGYFEPKNKKIEPLDINHHPEETPTRFNDHNTQANPEQQDRAVIDDLPELAAGKWMPGDLNWNIPHNFSVDGQGDHTFCNINQTLSVVDNDGTCRVDKDDQTTGLRNRHSA